MNFNAVAAKFAGDDGITPAVGSSNNCGQKILVSVIESGFGVDDALARVLNSDLARKAKTSNVNPRTAISNAKKSWLVS